MTPEYNIYLTKNKYVIKPHLYPLYIPEVKKINKLEITRNKLDEFTSEDVTFFTTRSEYLKIAGGSVNENEPTDNLDEVLKEAVIPPSEDIEELDISKKLIYPANPTGKLIYRYVIN